MAIAMVVPATASAGDGDEVTRTENLFVQTAGGGSLGNDAGGRLVLTLDDVDPRVVFFSERPERSAGTIPERASQGEARSID